MKRVFRVAPRNHPEFDGIGAALHPGRWNHANIRMVCCSESLAVAMLETLANSGELPENRVWIEAAIPDDVPVEEVRTLPWDWDSEKPGKATKDIGTEWASSLRTSVLRVPSTIAPGAFNFLVNPTHPDASRIVVNSPQPFTFDTRLRKRA